TSQERIDEAFIITRNGRYHGLARTIDVLKLITEMAFRTRHAAAPVPPSSLPVRPSLQSFACPAVGRDREKDRPAIQSPSLAAIARYCSACCSSALSPCPPPAYSWARRDAASGCPAAAANAHQRAASLPSGPCLASSLRLTTPIW